MPAVLPATRTSEAGSRCNLWIFRSLRNRADAARDQPGAGREPKLYRRKTLPKSSVAPLAANPGPGLMRRKRRPMRREQNDAVAFVAGIVDPGGSRARLACRHHRCRLQQWRLDSTRYDLTLQRDGAQRSQLSLGASPRAAT